MRVCRTTGLVSKIVNIHKFYGRMYAWQVHAARKTTRDLHARLRWRDLAGRTPTFCPRNRRISILSYIQWFHRLIACENTFATSQSSWKPANKHHSEQWNTKNSQCHRWALLLVCIWSGTQLLHGNVSTITRIPFRYEWPLRYASSALWCCCTLSNSSPACNRKEHKE